MQTHKVFVYGSLKRGYGNNNFLSDSKFVGEDVTKDNNYNLFSFGGFPGVIKGGGEKVLGELWEVDDDTLGHLDSLEGNGSFYQREIVPLESGEEAYMYITMGGEDNPIDRKDRVMTVGNVSNWGDMG